MLRRRISTKKIRHKGSCSVADAFSHPSQKAPQQAARSQIKRNKVICKMLFNKLIAGLFLILTTKVQARVLYPMGGNGGKKKKMMNNKKSSKSEYKKGYIKLRITNISFQQPFGGFFVATHNDKAPRLFTLGSPASPELARLAEDGNPNPLVDKYSRLASVGEAFAFTTSAPYFGGQTLEIEIPYDKKYPYVTVASMAINTNDCFVSINGRRLKSGDVFTGVGYDSGTEVNNELCTSIPGPACPPSTGNTADGGGEGFVHVHRGFFGIAVNEPNGLSAIGYDWRNPMVRFEVL